MQLTPFTQYYCSIPLGTHYCWVAGDNVTPKLAQGFYTWPVCRESNPIPLALMSITVPTQPCTEESTKVKL